MVVQHVVEQRPRGLHAVDLPGKDVQLRLDCLDPLRRGGGPGWLSGRTDPTAGRHWRQAPAPTLERGTAPEHRCSGAALPQRGYFGAWVLRTP
ncbi:MAG: hypothetical protein QOD82_1510, partial [Pseudonocardiales bacterium]|nr:hypothetical protein [Pseudonocardiales bacterium]